MSYLSDLSKGKTATGGSYLSNLANKPKTSTKVDLNSLEGLKQKATELGYEADLKKIAPEPKLSFLQRIGKGFGAFNPAEAILTGQEKGVGKGVLEYGKGIATGIGSAVTGRDFEGERRTFSDVAEKMGVKNKIAKFGIGFIGDVLLDPSTYFGGALAKGLVKGGKLATGATLRTVGKIAPEVETGIKLIGGGLKDAAGNALQYAYKSSKGAKEDVLSFLSKIQKAKLGLASSNLDRLGTGTLTAAQREELALKLIAGKRAEFVAKEGKKAIINDGQTLYHGTRGEMLEDKNRILFTAAEKGVAESYSNAVGISRTPSKVTGMKFDGERYLLNAENKFISSETGKSINFYDGKRLIERREAEPLLQNATVKKVSLGKDKKILDLTKNENVQELINTLENIKKTNKNLTPIQARKLDVFIAQTKQNGFDWGLTTDEFRDKFIGDIISPELKKKGYSGILFQDDMNKTTALFPGEWDFIPDGTVAPVVKSSDPVVQKIIEEQSARSKKFAETAGVENPYETYFPFIKKEKVDTFLKQTQGVKVGSKDYLKQFKNLLTNENMELDPAKAFFTREAQIVTDRIIADELNKFVKKYGKPLNEFKNTDDAIKAGYQLIKDKGLFGKELGYVNKYDANLIRNSIDVDYPTINMIAKATGFDAVTSLFKRSVTGLFAPFHVRNFASGMIQNFEVLGKDALNPKNITIGQKIAYKMGKGEKFSNELVEIGGKKMKFSQLIKPFSERFSGDTFYNSDFLQALNKGSELKQVQGAFSKGALKETAKTLGLGTEATPFKVARAVGQFIEHQQKATAYVTALAQGMSISEALIMAERAGFDYRALTKFESQILRRIIPFYSFTRKNIELQLRTMGENPQRINQILAFFENLGEPISEEERKALPAFIREAIGVKLQDTPEGLKQYISSFGTPIEAFTQLFGSNPVLRAISMMNPLLKAPIEIGIGKDSFRQKDLKDVYTANEYKMAPQIIKDLLDIREVKKDVLGRDSKGKLVKTGERTEYQADPVKLLIARSLFTSRGVSYLDQVFGNDLQGFVKVLKTTTGFKPQQVNLETVKAVEEKRQKREIEDLLTKRGDVRQYKSVYEPK